jgi:hypothetical protein
LLAIKLPDQLVLGRMLPARRSTTLLRPTAGQILPKILFSGSTSHPSFSPHFNTSRSFAMSPSNHSGTTSNGQTVSYKKVLSIDTINPAVREAKYAVRGELALRANELTEQVKKDNANLPFKDVVHCEIGNPQALDQKPLSFIRQVLKPYFSGR